MKTSYLTRTRRFTEILAALYGVYFGASVTVLLDTGWGSPLYWVWSDPVTQKAAGLTFVLAGVVHAIGVRVNGRWRWSPLFRVVGLSILTMLMFKIFLAGAWQEPNGVTSGGVTYAPFVLVFAFYTATAARDLWHSLKIARLLDGISQRH